MDHETGKPAWTKPAGRYRTATGRRYGRRYAYVSFRPSLHCQDRDGHYERLESADAEKENSLCSSPLVRVSSVLLDEPLLENTGTGEPVYRSVASQTYEVNTSPFSPFSCGLEGNKISGNFMNPYENSEDLAEYASGGCNDLNSQNGIAFVNIDSYKPDSSDGVEGDAQDRSSLAKEEASVFQETLDNLFSELEKGVETFADLQSRLSPLNHSVSREWCEKAGPMPLMKCSSMRYSSIHSDLACPNRTFESSAEDQPIPKSNLSGANCKPQQINTVDVGVRTPVAIPNELNVSGKTDQGNSPELVVRPKIRRQNTANQLEGERLLPSDDEEESGSWRSEIAEVRQGCAETTLRNSEEMRSSMFFDSEYKGHQKNTETDLRKNAAAQEQSVLDGNTSWDEFEDRCSNYSMCHKDEDSSECSDGEWYTPVPTYSTAAEELSSSDDGWETVLGSFTESEEECKSEAQSSSSAAEEEDTDFFFHGREPSSLEEGATSWSQYREDIGSSSGEDDNLHHDFVNEDDFVYPGFLLLDGNNNLEDDSNVSEDLDMEWRLFEEFSDGLGFSQVVPSADLQFLSLTALDGRLQQAVEAALTHLEALGFETEQAPPPATKETIDCLPQIIVTDDRQDQCCTICCSEYVKDEIITELPCHHLFHKLCVTLWLETSGTCPVCRHVLAPVLPEAAAAMVSFRSDYDSTSSVRSATEASN